MGIGEGGEVLLKGRGGLIVEIRGVKTVESGGTGTGEGG